MQELCQTIYWEKPAIIQAMILITGGTGFIGTALTRKLVSQGLRVRLLIRPSKTQPKIPKGVPVEVAVCSLNDERGLRAAMRDVRFVYHLAGAEALGTRAELEDVDMQGTEILSRACVGAKIERLIFLSHLGADRHSFFPLLKAKAIAESFIKNSGVKYSIFRTGVVYGPSDHFTNGLGFMLKSSPFFVALPDHGATLLQPLWIEDLLTCLAWCLDMPETVNRVYEIGGPEHLSLRDICEQLAAKMGIKRFFYNLPPVLMHYLHETLEVIFPGIPVSVFLMDYFACDRICSPNSLPDSFGIMPARFDQMIDYYSGKIWKRYWWRVLFRRRKRREIWE